MATRLGRRFISQVARPTARVARTVNATGRRCMSTAEHGAHPTGSDTPWMVSLYVSHRNALFLHAPNSSDWLSSCLRACCVYFIFRHARLTNPAFVLYSSSTFCTPRLKRAHILLRIPTVRTTSTMRSRNLRPRQNRYAFWVKYPHARPRIARALTDMHSPGRNSGGGTSF